MSSVDPSFFCPETDELSHGPALLWRLHLAEGPVLLDGVVGGPIPHCPDGEPVGLEVRADADGVTPALVLTSRAEARAFLTLLSAAVDVCFP